MNNEFFNKYLFTKNNKICFDLIGKKKASITFVLWMLFCIGIVLCCIGLSFYNKLEIIFNIGIDVLLTTGLSLVFLWIDKLSKKNEKLQDQAVFYEKLYFVFYNIIFFVTYLDKFDKDYNCTDFLHANHREFHDHYKKMLVNKKVEGTRSKIININSFCSKFDDDILQLEKLYFSKIINIEEFDTDYNMFLYYNDLSNKRINAKDRIKAMGFFLDEVKSLIESKKNLETLKLIKIKLIKGEVKIDIKELQRIEPKIKFIEEFNHIRTENYKKLYEIKNNNKKKVEDKL